MNTTRSTRLAIWTALFLFLLVLAILAAITLYKANSAADYSAHAALTAEICDRLAAVPSGQRFPDSLSELRLTDPDGGDGSLLRRFTYHSTGTSCIVRTTLRGQEFSRSYP